jgi:hypothetical protein
MLGGDAQTQEAFSAFAAETIRAIAVANAGKSEN